MVGGDEEGNHMIVNSYHHHGVWRLTDRFVSMAFASDGLVERFYNPDTYNPCDGKFIMGLQFHPECMRKTCSDEFDIVFTSCDHFVRLMPSNQPHYPSLCPPTSHTTLPLSLNRHLYIHRALVLSMEATASPALLDVVPNVVPHTIATHPAIAKVPARGCPNFFIGPCLIKPEKKLMPE
jgi:hypothetical protein